MHLHLEGTSAAAVALEVPLKMVFPLGKNQPMVINFYLGCPCSSQLSALSSQLLIFS
jgi:hypothetical protein